MAIDSMNEASNIVKDYLLYMQTVKGKSPKTVDEYLDFIEKELDFVQKRNNRIRQSIL